LTLLTATKKGIVVTNVTDYAVNEVAEHALALLFSCIRKIASHDKKYVLVPGISLKRILSIVFRENTGAYRSWQDRSGVYQEGKGI